MGKKNKKVEIILNNEELIPTTIGYLEEEKKSSLVLVILFVIFIAFALFLPDITSKINKLLGNDEDIIITPTKEEEKEENSEENNVTMYDFSESLTFTYKDLTFSNFKKYQLEELYYISITLKNNSKKTINFTNDKYYLEVYSYDKTLLGRRVFNNDQVNADSTNIQLIELSENEYNNFSKLVISLKTEKDYPEVVLTENVNKEYSLNCSKTGNSINYVFDKNNKLTRIKDTVNTNNDFSTRYSQTLSFYQSQVANYNNKTGVSSSLVEISTGFTVTTDINVKTAKINELSTDNYYSTDTSPKVVKFEMEARGYSCQ